MPYPLIYHPTWSEFIDTMKGWGVEFVQEEICGPNNKPVKISHFSHKMDGDTLWCEVDIVDMDDRLTASMIRHVCKRLRINPKPFGLTLG